MSNSAETVKYTGKLLKVFTNGIICSVLSKHCTGSAMNGIAAEVGVMYRTVLHESWLVVAAGNVSQQVEVDRVASKRVGLARTEHLHTRETTW